MSILLFVSAEYHNKAEYDRYVELSTPIFMREGVKILANDTAPVAMTQNMKADKAVLLEFRDNAHMKRFFELEDYKAAAVHRDGASTLSAMKFERFELPT